MIGEELAAAVVVVVVRVIHVLMDGKIGTGIGTGMTGWGFIIGPQACFERENSRSHSLMALRRARLGWYMLGVKLEGMSSPVPPSSVSVSSFISAATESSENNETKTMLF